MKEKMKEGGRKGGRDGERKEEKIKNRGRAKKVRKRKVKKGWMEKERRCRGGKMKKNGQGG